MITLKLAGLCVGIDNRFDYIEKFAEDYLTDAIPDFTVSVTDDELAKEATMTEVSFSDGYLESIVAYRKIAERLPEYDAVVFHGAILATGGRAYAFTARSGVGKTTHTRLWISTLGADVHYLNGDKPIIRMIDGVPYAFGTPWRGKEFLGCNMKAPVRGMCILRRGLENSIAPASSHDAVGQIFHQVLLPQDGTDLASFMSMMDKIIKNVPMYNLYCNMEDDAARVAYNGMRGN